MVFGVSRQNHRRGFRSHQISPVASAQLDNGALRFFAGVQNKSVAIGFFVAGEVDAAFEWMKGLAKTTRQGPIAQAHFTEAFLSPESNGGAIKSTSDQPYINDWACVSGCNYLEPIVDSIFGIDASLFGNITAKPNFGRFAAKAELRNITYQGKKFVADKKGIRTV